MAPLRDESGFTLIEIIVVVAIVAFLTAMAVSTVQSGIPRTKIIADMTEVRQEMIKARTRAVRDGHLTKLCIYRSSNPTVLANNGLRYFLLECDDFGAGGCNIGNANPFPIVCNNVNTADSAGPWISAAGVEVPTSASTVDVAVQNPSGAASMPAQCPIGTVTGGVATVSDGRWCLLETYNLAAGSHAPDAVSANTFYSAAGTTSPYANSALGGTSVLELTYGTDGTLLGAPYSANPQGAQGGYIDFTSVYACYGAANGNTTCGTAPQGPAPADQLTNRMFLHYSLGGAVQVVSQ